MHLLLLGLPNVGKSSIYNILTKNDKNIIHSKEGTTRDWHFDNIENYKGLYIYDTPGIIFNKNKLNLNQINSLLERIDIFLYVVDYKNQQILLNKHILSELRKLNKKIILIVNKDDNLENNNYFIELGLSEIFYITCSHNLGLEDLKFFLSKFQSPVFTNNIIDFSIAILGKTNAGKSTLLNNILGYNRSITSNKASTTSDIVQDKFIYKNKTFKVLDTAGILKKSKIEKKTVNYFSIKKSIESIKKVDLGLLIIDSQEGFDRQTKRIFSLLIKKSSLLFLVFNKIDLIKQKKNYYSEIKSYLESSISNSKNISILFISAHNKKDINKVKNLIYTKANEILFSIPTNKINTWLKKATANYAHPLIKGYNVKFKYAVQTKTSPITIKIFSNFSSQIKNNYKTYLINNFNKTFKIKDKQIKLFFSQSKNPYN